MKLHSPVVFSQNPIDVNEMLEIVSQFFYVRIACMDFIEIWIILIKLHDFYKTHVDFGLNLK